MAEKRFIFINGHFQFFYLTDSELSVMLEELSALDNYHEVAENVFRVGSLEKLQSIYQKNNDSSSEEEPLCITFFAGDYIVLEANEDFMFNRLEKLDKVFSCHQVTPYIYKIFEL